MRIWLDRSLRSMMLATASMAFYPVAYAQADEGATSIDAGDTASNVIIVTAQKREQAITDVPIAIRSV